MPPRGRSNAPFARDSAVLLHLRRAVIFSFPFEAGQRIKVHYRLAARASASILKHLLKVLPKVRPYLAPNERSECTPSRLQREVARSLTSKRVSLLRESSPLNCQFKKNTGAQLFFAKLNEGNLGGNGGGDNFKNVYKLFTRRCRLDVRCSARDQVDDWLHVSRHLACAALRPHFPARRGACV